MGRRIRHRDVRRPDKGGRRPGSVAFWQRRQRRRRSPQQGARGQKRETICLRRGQAGIVGQVPGPPAACLPRAAGPREKFMRPTRTAAAAVLRRHGRGSRDARTRAAPRPFSCAIRRAQGAVVVLLLGRKRRLRSQAANPGAAYLAQRFGTSRPHRCGSVRAAHPDATSPVSGSRRIGRPFRRGPCKPRPRRPHSRLHACAAPRPGPLFQAFHPP